MFVMQYFSYIDAGDFMIACEYDASFKCTCNSHYLLAAYFLVLWKLH